MFGVGSGIRLSPVRYCEYGTHVYVENAKPYYAACWPIALRNEPTFVD